MAITLSVVCLGGVTRRVAAQFPAQGDDTMLSMGVFRVVVAPAFRPLLAPNPPTYPVGYPGYTSADGRLTSPNLIDFATKVGRSGPHNRLLAGSVPVGVPSMGNLGYADYPAIPFLFAAAPPPTREILTQIRSFALETSRENCPTNDPRVPLVPLLWVMIKAGPDQGLVRKSVGMVQSSSLTGLPANDFPDARSFFDIFVEVNLPPLPGTYSSTAFPVTGAILYNDLPLIISNLDVDALPPFVVYIHGETTAVPLKFRDNRPGFWNADDVFGYLVLAGHGTQAAGCASETAFLDAVLGPIGTSRPELPIEWPFPNDLCPSPNTTYNSVPDLDVINFTIPGAGTIRTRNYVHGNLQNPIPPPPLGSSSIYSFANTFVQLETSIDGNNWSPTVANGGVAARIAHTSSSGQTRFFDTEMLQLNLTGIGPVGPFMIRESPTRASLGKHTIRRSTQGSLISSFFDVNLELSTDGVQWVRADRSVRVQVDHAPCGAVGAQLHATLKNNAIVLTWSDPSYTLQSRAGLAPTAEWVDMTATSPVTVPTGQQTRLFRLICK